MPEPPLRVAVDAMGGDNAPKEVLGGAVWAARELGVEVLLVGPTQRIQRDLDALGAGALPIRVVEAPEVIEMAEAPAMALRRKRQASILVAVETVRRGGGDAVGRAGHPRAAVAAPPLPWGRGAGVGRAAGAPGRPARPGPGAPGGGWRH